jgi:curved DNA-binding protein CbpA
MSSPQVISPNINYNTVEVKSGFKDVESDIKFFLGLVTDEAVTLKKHYTTLSLRFHPDTCKEKPEDCEANFKKVSAAYETLKTRFEKNGGLGDKTLISVIRAKSTGINRSSGYGANSSASNSATAPTTAPTTAPATSKSFIPKEVLGTRTKIRLEKFYNALLERLSNIGHPITVDLTTASGIVRLIDEANKYGLIFIFRPSGNIYNDIQREAISYYNNVIRDPHYKSFGRDPEQRKADARAYIEYINQLDLNIDQNKQALIEAAIYEITLDDEKYKSYFPSVASTGGNSSASSSSAGPAPAPAPAATSSAASLSPEEKIQRVKDIADIPKLQAEYEKLKVEAETLRKSLPDDAKDDDPRTVAFHDTLKRVNEARDSFVRVERFELLRRNGDKEVTQIFNDIADICKLPQIKSERDVAFSNFTRDNSSENIRAYNLASSRYSRVFKVKEILGITDTPSSCSLQGGRRSRKSRKSRSRKSCSRKSRQSIRRSTSRKVKRRQ